MLWLCVFCGVLILIIIMLLIKVTLMRKAADEIRTEFGMRLENDTNTLISISSRDCSMRRLAAGINTQLRLLREQRRRFQGGNLELTEAVTNISHDLRTPLTAIFGYLDLLKREKMTDPAGVYLNMIENRAEALKQLTEELFSYSVIVSSAEGAVYNEVMLNSALEESFSAYYAALKGVGITPEISMPERKVWRRLDGAALSRIFGNVINNAIKYSDGDLSVVLQESGEIVFSNYANSLTPVTAGRLFDRFYTVETGRGSTGLGLSIAKLLTEQMGGSVSSEYLNGRLYITLRFPRAA